MSRTPPSAADFLFALAASLEHGTGVQDTLGLIARAGPASARMARRLTEELRGGALAAALVKVGLIGHGEQPLMALAEENGRLPAALRWAAEKRRISDERRRTVRNAVLGPLLLAGAGLLLEPLPQLILGSATFWSAIWPLLFLGGLVALGFKLVPRAPLIGSLARLDGEASAAALISVFADANQLALAPRAARALGLQPWADALTAIAADPLASVPSFSEPFALALQVGISAGDLPARFAALHQSGESHLTAQLRRLARVLVFSLLGLIALQGVWKLLSSPLPGLNGDLGNSPELKELEKELENAGH